MKSAPGSTTSKPTPVVSPKPIPGWDAGVTITKKQDLQFGRMVMTGTGGSVALPVDGLPVYSGLVPTGTAPTFARFEIRGPANRIVQLRLTFPMSGEYGAGGNSRLDELSVTADFRSAFRQNETTVMLKLDSSGMNAIVVGGKLTLSSAVVGKTDILIPISATLVTQ